MPELEGGSRLRQRGACIRSGTGTPRQIQAALSGAAPWRDACVWASLHSPVPPRFPSAHVSHGPCDAHGAQAAYFTDGDECHGQSHVARGWRRSHAQVLSQGSSCSTVAFENGGLCPSLHNSSALMWPQRARGASARCPPVLGVTVLPSPGKSQAWLPLEARRPSSLLTVPWACWTGKGSAQPLAFLTQGPASLMERRTTRWHVGSDH